MEQPIANRRHVNVLTSALMPVSVPAVASAGAPCSDAALALASFSAAELLQSKRCIASVDADCFYAQCEELRHPELKGKPVGVQQKMLVITSNYAARAYGVAKGDSLDVVRRKCPQIEIKSGEDLTFYRHVSQQVFDYVCRWSKEVERLGMDEVFVDLTQAVDDAIAAGGRGSSSRRKSLASRVFTGHAFGEEQPTAASEGKDVGAEPCEDVDEDAAVVIDDDEDCGAPRQPSALVAASAEDACRMRLSMASAICDEMRQGLLHEVGITTSAGISVNKLLSKMVASEHKPHKQTTLVPTAAILGRLLPDEKPINLIPGIGFARTRRWKEEVDPPVQTIGQLLQASTDHGAVLLPSPTTGLPPPFERMDVVEMRRLCRGLCDKAVTRSARPKSVSAGDSFWQKPLASLPAVEAAVRVVVPQLMLKLRQDEAAYGTCVHPASVTVTLRHHNKETRQRCFSRTVKVGLQLGRRPPPQARAAADTQRPVSLDASDQASCDSVTRLAVRCFRELVDTSRPFAIDILNVAFKFGVLGGPSVAAGGAASLQSLFTQQPAAPPGGGGSTCGAAVPGQRSEQACQDSRDAAASPGKGANTTTAAQAMAPSVGVEPGEIDESVLRELPLSLQKEIRQGMWLAAREQQPAAREQQPDRKKQRTASGGTAGGSGGSGSGGSGRQTTLKGLFGHGGKRASP